MRSLALFALAAATLSTAAFADEPDGKAIYEARCQKCHGADGKSQTKIGKKLHADDFTRAKWQKHNTDEEIIHAITEGAGRKKQMPAFKDKLSEGEIKAVALYLRSFAPGVSPAGDHAAPRGGDHAAPQGGDKVDPHDAAGGADKAADPSQR